MFDYTLFDSSVNSPMSPGADRHTREAGAVAAAAWPVHQNTQDIRVAGRKERKGLSLYKQSSQNVIKSLKMGVSLDNS
jgi:hypothetical protein